MTDNSLKKWDNDIYVFDVTEASRVKNPWLEDFGRDRFTYEPEYPLLTALDAKINEAHYAHGYPLTSWLQLSLVYAAGLYTAKEQGIVKKGVYFQKYWRAHYFDWLMFIRRAGIYGIGGGLVAGTYLFGSPYVSVRRIINGYHYYFTW